MHIFMNITYIYIYLFNNCPKTEKIQKISRFIYFILKIKNINGVDHKQTLFIMFMLRK